MHGRFVVPFFCIVVVNSTNIMLILDIVVVLCSPHEWLEFKMLNSEFTGRSQIKKRVRRSLDFEGTLGFSALTASREAP